MARSRRRSGRPARHRSEDGSRPSGSGGFLGQIGLFETGNGLPHGPAAVALAIVAALVIYPIARFVRYLTRR